MRLMKYYPHKSLSTMPVTEKRPCVLTTALIIIKARGGGQKWSWEWQSGRSQIRLQRPYCLCCYMDFIMMVIGRPFVILGWGRETSLVAMWKVDCLHKGGESRVEVNRPVKRLYKKIATYENLNLKMALKMKMKM